MGLLFARFRLESSFAKAQAQVLIRLKNFVCHTMEALDLQPFVCDFGLAWSFDNGIRSRPHETVANADFESFGDKEEPMTCSIEDSQAMQESFVLL